jgi:hypothetical protein
MAAGEHRGSGAKGGVRGAAGQEAPQQTNHLDARDVEQRALGGLTPIALFADR